MLVDNIGERSLKSLRSIRWEYLIFFLVLLFLLSIIVINVNEVVEDSNRTDEYSCYINGDGNEIARVVKVDQESNLILAGWTNSKSLGDNAHRLNLFSGRTDGYVAKFTDQCQLIWLRYLGGSQDDGVMDVAVSTENEIYVLGNTNSADFPIQAPKGENVIDFSLDENDIFVTKLSSTGELIWSSFLDGTGTEFATSLELDYNNNLVISGLTTSSNFPVKKIPVIASPHSLTYTDKWDGVILVISPDLEIIWGTYYGGSADDLILDTAVDTTGNYYAVGFTSSLNSSGIPFDPMSPFSASGNRDLFLAKFNNSGSLIFHKILGTGFTNSSQDVLDFEERMILVLDQEENLIIGGWVRSNPLDGLEPLNTDDASSGFVSKYDQNGSLIWSRRLGGNQQDSVKSLVIDGSNNILITGETYSNNFEVENSRYYSFSGSGDAFVTKLDSDGKMIWSSYFGGSYWDMGLGVTIDPVTDLIYVVGFTASTDFPADNSISGYADVYLMALNNADLTATTSNLPKGLIRFVNIFIENTSVFEWIMIFGTIILSLRTLTYYRLTRVKEFLLITSIFASLALNSILQVIAFLITNPRLANMILLFRQPYIGLSLTWVLILWHSFRIRWESNQMKLLFIATVLFTIKLLVPIIIIFFGEQFNLSFTNVAILSTISFLLFDFYVLIILLYSYYTLDIFVPTKRVNRAYRLWEVNWLLFTIGFLVLTLLTGAQIWLLSQGQSLENTDSLIILVRNLTLIFDNGINFFIVFAIIAFISLFLPEGILLSETQYVTAVQLYRQYQDESTRGSLQKLSEMGRSSRSLINYLKQYGQDMSTKE